MKKGIEIKYDPEYADAPRFWIMIWKYERVLPKIHFRHGWAIDEQTHFPKPTVSSVKRCLALMSKLNEEI